MEGIGKREKEGEGIQKLEGEVVGWEEREEEEDGLFTCGQEATRESRMPSRRPAVCCLAQVARGVTCWLRLTMSERGREEAYTVTTRSRRDGIKPPTTGKRITCRRGEEK